MKSSFKLARRKAAAGMALLASIPFVLVGGGMAVQGRSGSALRWRPAEPRMLSAG